jgi:hypothetical protein
MDFFSSFFQNVKDKLTSPFFGTLTFILLVHHWEFWYTLFTIESNLSSRQKVEVLKYIGAREFKYQHILEDVGWTILVVSAGYGIIVLTRSLSLYIDFRIMPAITNQIINKNVVLKSQYDEMFLERDNYAERYEAERQNNRLLSKSYDELGEEIKNKNLSTSDANDLITKLNNDIISLNYTIQTETQKNTQLSSDNLHYQEQIQALQTSTSDLENDLEFAHENLKIYREIFLGQDNRMYWSTIAEFPPSVENKVSELKNNGLWNGFKSVVSFDKRGGSISTQIYIDLRPYDVIVPDGADRLNAMGSIIAANLERFEKDR